MILENHLDDTSIPTFSGDMYNSMQSLMNMIDIFLYMIHSQKAIFKQ